MQHGNKKHDDPFKIMKRCYQNANLIPKGPLNPKLNLQKCAGLSAIQKCENQKTKKTKKTSQIVRGKAKNTKKNKRKHQGATTNAKTHKKIQHGNSKHHNRAKIMKRCYLERKNEKDD